MDKTKIKIGVVSMATLAMSGSVAGSAIAAISKSFPTTPISTIQLLSTLPGLGSLIISLIAGQMAMHISKKKLVLLGVALVTIGGLLPAFWNSSIVGLLICSIVLGMGVGFVSTINPMLLSQYFEGEERSTMMGVNTGFTSLGSMILTGVGGFLGGSNWRHLYWVFAVGIIVFLLVLFCLPNDKVDASAAGETASKPKTSTWSVIKSLSPSVYLIYLVVFLLGIAFTAYMANLSIVVAQKNMGGTAMTGMINAVGTIGGIIAGLGFKYLRKFTKPNTLAAGFVFLIITLAVTYYFNNTIALMIAAIFSSVAMVTVMSTAPFMLSMVSAPQQIPVVMSVFAFVNGLSSAIAPKLISWCHVPAGAPSFVFAGIISAVVVVVLVATRFEKKVESGQLLADTPAK
ncbi:MFS transporter [Lactobacillus porci]|uniref:MFS transporter n=1 Tax=Lactobacillus porci TaxID=2012477 RepID=UPI003994D27F